MDICRLHARALTLSLIATLTLAFPVPLRSEAPPDAATIERLIKQLGSEDFAQRDAADQRLDALGEPALLPLRKAAIASDDAEIRSRAQQLVERLRTRLFRAVRQLAGHTGQVDCLAISGDGRRLLTGSLDASLRLWDVTTGKELHCFDKQPGGVWATAITRDGKRGLSSAGLVSKDGKWIQATDFTIRLWDLEACKEIGRLTGHTGEVRSAVFAPDERRILSGGRDKTLRLWDVVTGKEIRRFEGHAAVIRSVAFSSDGRRVLSASRDKTVRLWDVETGKELQKLEGHTDDVFSVVFSPDGRRALSGGADRTLRLWDLTTGKELRRFEGHTTVIWCVALSPDGRRAISGAGSVKSADREGYYVPASEDNEVRLWDVESGQEIHRFEGPTSSVMSVLFTSDGRHVLAGGSDRLVHLWQAGGPRK